MPISINKFLSKATKFIDRSAHRIAGTSAREWENKSRVLNEAKKNGTTPLRADRMAKVEREKSTRARVKGGILGVAVTTSGFLGLHKYHQHQDNEILRKIDSMYGSR